MFSLISCQHASAFFVITNCPRDLSIDFKLQGKWLTDFVMCMATVLIQQERERGGERGRERGREREGRGREEREREGERKQREREIRREREGRREGERD